MEVIFVRVSAFDPVLRPFGEGHAVPGVFVRAIAARLGPTGPAGHFELVRRGRSPGLISRNLISCIVWASWFCFPPPAGIGGSGG